jgi:hypothetical protein
VEEVKDSAAHEGMRIASIRGVEVCTVIVTVPFQGNWVSIETLTSRPSSCVVKLEPMKRWMAQILPSTE